MNRILFALTLALAAFVSLRAEAIPLRLDYQTTPAGAQGFYYEFELILDNNDGSWTPGDQWGWIIFGDVPFSQTPSPIADFTEDSLSFPAGPWTGVTATSGSHNGPTLNFVLDLWEPSFVGDSVTWAGWSQANVISGLRWSSIAPSGFALAADFELANRVPEPTSAVLGGLMLVSVAASGRRRRR